METQRLLDAITDHLAVYHRGAPTPSSESSQSRQTIIKWMASLSIDQRRAALTVWDGPWVEILLMMQEHVRDGGPCTFFLLPDVPVTKQPKHTTAGSRGSKCSLKRADNEKVSMKDCRQSRPRGIKGMGALGCGEKSDKAEPPTISTPLPALCVRKARGLLRRLESRQTSGALLVNNIRLFSSEGGVNMCNASNLNAGFVPDCITVTENFVSNMDTFVDVMNEISFGEFLKTPCLTAVSSWEEMPWLKASGYYSIPAFIANKFEFGLWSAWSRAQGPKRPPRSLVLKSKIGWSANSSATCTNGNAGLGATLFERQQGWKEWWRKLGSKERTKVATGAVFLVTKSEVVKLHEEATRSNVLDPGFSGCCQSMPWNSSSVKGNAISRKISSGLDIDELPRVRRADHRGTTVAPYLICLEALKEISEAGFLFGKTEGMNPLREDGDSWLFDSSLMTVHSFSDRVRRKVRNALFKVRNDMVEFELLGDETSDKVRRVGGAENTKVKTTKAKKKRRKSSVLPKLHVFQGRENSANLDFSHSKVGKPQLQAESEPAGPGIEIQNLDHQNFESTAMASSGRGEEVIRQGKGVKLSKELKFRHAVPDYPTRNEDTNCSDDTCFPYVSSGMCKDPNNVSFRAASDAESLLCTETSFNISVADDYAEQGRSDACMSQLEKEKLGSSLVPAVFNLPSDDNSANFTEKDGNFPENLILMSCNSPLVDSSGNDHNYDDANALLSEGSAGVREHLTWSPSDPRLKVKPECQVSNQIQGDILKPVLDTSSLHDVERRTHAKGEYEGPVPIRFGTVDGSLPELKSSSCATIMAKAFANAITAEPGSDVALDRKAENDLPQTVWNRRDTVALVSGYESKEETLELAVSDGQSASRPGSVRPRFTKTSKQFDHSNSRHLQYQRSQAFRTRPHEWPGSPQISYFGSYHRPTAPDWLQLDEGSGWPHRVQSPFVTYSNSTVLRQQGGQIERPTLRSVASWASNVGSMDRASAGQPSYNVSPVGGYGISSQEEPRLNVRPTLNATPFSSGCSELETSSPGRKLCLEKEDRFAYDTDGDDCGICRSLEFDDLDGYVISEEEGDKFTDAPESSSADYNQIFGGGVMYWNAADYTGLGYSRPGSLSSEDSSWARHEADLSAVLDDIVNYQPLQASFSAKAPANSSGRSCSSSPPSSSSVPISFDHLGPSLNSRLCKPRAGMDFSGKFVHLTNQGVTADDHSVGTRVPVTLEVMEQFGADSSTKPVLRPIVVVRDLSRQTSGVDVCRVQETKSPHIASRSRRESSGHRRRPPSPVSRCVPPPAPPPPPPSPVSGPRRRKGFMAARSGSSSPRHWGFINLSHKDESKWPEVPGLERNEDSGLRRGSLGTTSARHSVSGAVLRERLVPTLTVEQEHPVVSTPMKTTLLHNSNPAFHLGLSKLLSILNVEIGAFKWQVETENKQRRPFIDIAVKKVEHSLQVLWPRSRTNIFGSVATGLALPTSDVDLVVYLPPVRNLEPIKEAGILEGRNGIKETCLQHAARYLADQDWVKNDSMKIIENTTVPVIMMVAEFLPQQCGTGDEDALYSFGAHNRKESLEEAPRVKSEESKRLSGPGFCKEDKSLVTENPNGPWGGISARQLVHLDISFETPFHTGLRTADLVRELVGQYPALSPLALVLKQFLTDRSLDRPYTGGLSSYCLVLLITRFLQHQQRGKPSSNQNLGRLLMDFLHFFGCVFDPRRMGVRIRGGGMYVSRDQYNNIDPLYIEDPLYPDNNVGRNCFRVLQCLKAFADGYGALESKLQDLSIGPDEFGDSSECLAVLQLVLPCVMSK